MSDFHADEPYLNNTREILINLCDSFVTKQLLITFKLSVSV